jgi:nucleoside-diphosphate-sugar epimerase
MQRAEVKLRTMIAVITGANGFIGTHLVRRFREAGWDVRPVVRQDFRSGNVDRLLDGADITVHAAGATRAPSHALLRASNVELTERVLEASKRGGVRRFVYISSQAAAGPAASHAAPSTERSSPMPVEAYGRSKLQAEQLIRNAGAVPFVIVRPAAVYGPGDRDFLPLFRLASHGVALHPGNKHQWISIIHVDDLVGGVLRAATDMAAVANTFFLANEQPVQWSSVFQQVAACAGKKLHIDMQVPRFLVDIAAAGGDLVGRATGRAPLLTTEKVALSDAPHWICSSEHARRAIEFITPTTLQAGMCATYHWYLTNGWL